MPFQRKLDEEFIEELNQLHDQPASWWRELVDSKDVFLAIRNNSINAYSNGMSIGKILRDKNSGVVKLLVHEEYLSLTNTDPYVNILSGQTNWNRKLVFNEKGYLENLSRIKNRAGLFGGDERIGTNKIGCKVLSVLDMEAAFKGIDQDPNPENKKEILTKRGRLDLIALTSNFRLVAIEAKLYANKQDLRGKGILEVSNQLKDYHHFLSTNREDLEVAYQNMVAIFGKLRGKFFEKRTKQSNWQKIITNLASITIDPVPRLLIFDFDKLQRKGAYHDANQIQLHAKKKIPDFNPKCVIKVGKTDSITEKHLI